MNLVLITSVVNTRSGQGIYSSEERLNQLINDTIRSLIKFIPNCYIVLLEGSNLSEDQKNSIVESGVDEIFFTETSNMQKSYGEISLIYSYLSSDSFHNLESKIETISKISGRYYLVEGFDFEKIQSNNVIKKDHSRQVCETRFYKLVYNDLGRYKEGLRKLFTDGIKIDLEHSFYEYNIIDCVVDYERIYLSGYQAPAGDFIED